MPLNHAPKSAWGPRYGALVCLLLLAPAASAQLTSAEEKPAPNILLLVDTSGSMELKADGTLPTCHPGVTSSTNDRSRWIDLIEVLTGSFDGYSCWAQDRSTAAFESEFSLEGHAPYDMRYVYPYHRALSNSCVVGPGVAPSSTSPYSWPNRAVNTFAYSAGAVTRPSDLAGHSGCSAFNQASDGLLDIYGSQARFGLMTFDTLTNAGTGVSSGVGNPETGIAGTWSYYVGQSVSGHPANCSYDLPHEVGARNAAAPPWEGRLIAFGPPDEADGSLRNSWLQQALLAMRPYGATPVAGLLHDARDFLWNDTSTDPLASGEQFGPTNDPSWRAANCRKTIVILLTDGEPNLDLRPACESEPAGGTAGRCPYDPPADIVSSLRLSPPAPSLSVETYVIGFALGEVSPAGESQPLTCAEVTDTHCADPRNDDDTARSRAVQACCTLKEIAAAGGLDENDNPRPAYFADNREELRSIFTGILDGVVQISTRTLPVFAGSGGDSASSGFKFFSAFNPRPHPGTASLWEGVLERRRFVCNEDLVAEERFEPEAGDDFAANVSSGTGPDRLFYSVVSTSDLRNSLRPALTTDVDGVGVSDASQIGPAEAAEFPGSVSASHLQVSASDCTSATSANDCRTLILEHAVGLTNRLGVSRCPTGSTCNVLGGIYHSTPTAVPGRPSDLIRDESYGAFVASMAAAARPSTLYTATVDGFLHAFKLAPFPGSVGAQEQLVSTTTNNELWAFVPPAVLPVMKTQYPATPAVLLDGAPVIKDVVARDDSGQLRFERRRSEAEVGAGLWRSALVSGFGVGQVSGGYFALDVTKPEVASGGPRFLWQLTRDDTGHELFGSGGTPLITTLYLGTTDPKEVAVAVLPGGDAAPTPSATTTAIGTIMDTLPSGYETSRPVNGYPNTSPARSLTIVRLDTGEVVRTFRPSTGASLFNSQVVTETEIPSPIVGQPQAYPGTTGAVADRIFVGDRDGRMWRVDVSSADPADWTMQVFFDAFWDGNSAALGQPIELPPALSVDDDGNLTVAFATGDQRATAAPSTQYNRVISLTEQLDPATNDFAAHLNWVQELEGGERVTGPMVLFNRALYYAASRPPTSNNAACSTGSSRLFAAHYLQDHAQSQALTPNPSSGPAKAPGAPSLVVSSRSDGMIFGVSLESRPSCSTALETVPTDASFGYGQVRQSSSVNPGSFYLSYSVSGSGEGERGVLEVKEALQTPNIPATFESWALIYE